MSAVARRQRREGNAVDEREVRDPPQRGKKIEAKKVIPCHYDLFTFNTADVNDFISEAEKIGQPYKVLRGGERFSGN